MGEEQMKQNQSYNRNRNIKDSMDQTGQNKMKDQSSKDKINLDYDWNSEYGDGDIPDIDKQ
ncbi:hypothetical protein lbkm_2319 [Lachnospiraceae bacterium KM106-2]|nr:hypothetical protein lbkm_2319 [Lachnospiraceae bacterium KM106-2]